MTSRLVAILMALVFIAIALVLRGVIFQFAGYSALSMFQSIVDGAFLRHGAALLSLRWALPLFVTAVGVSISFRCCYFNIGAQGQFYRSVRADATALVESLPGEAIAAHADVTDRNAVEALMQVAADCFGARGLPRPPSSLEINRERRLEPMRRRPSSAANNVQGPPASSHDRSRIAWSRRRESRQV